jgi:hypothetical protein
MLTTPHTAIGQLIEENSAFYLQIRLKTRKTEIQLCQVSPGKFMLKDLKDYKNIIKRCGTVETWYKEKLEEPNNQSETVTPFPPSKLDDG